MLKDIVAVHPKDNYTLHIMGSPADEPERFDREDPQLEVTVAPFFMGKYPVTQAQWRFVSDFLLVSCLLTPVTHSPTHPETPKPPSPIFHRTFRAKGQLGDDLNPNQYLSYGVSQAGVRAHALMASKKSNRVSG